MNKKLLLGSLFIFLSFAAFCDSWYVRAGGNDNNSGLSEALPFGTLAKAVKEASSGAVKTITVIGTLDYISEKGGGYSSVFYIDAENADPITITGKLNTAEDERAVLNGRDASCPVVHVEQGSYIRFEHIDITGAKNTSNNGGGIYIDSKAAVTVGAGTRIFENSADAGGGIYSASGSKLLMLNARVFSNKAKWGGGIYSRGEINIEDSDIYANTAETYGGGIEINGNDSFMKKCRINGNKAGTCGGGIFVVKEYDIQLTDCVISGNEGYRGGGLGIDGTVTMYGGTIEKNATRYGRGGGIIIEKDGSFIMKDGHISGNNCLKDSGGGIAVLDGGKCFIENGIISKNRAGSEGNNYNGGGIFVDNGGEFSMDKGLVSGNTATWSGGGININEGMKTYIKNIRIAGNYSEMGGGIGVSRNLELSDCLIEENYALNSGGGIFVFLEGNLTVHGGEISGNHANQYGGAVRIEGKSELYNVKILKNQAVWGGGIFTMTSFLLQDCIISGNRAFHGGGLVTTNQNVLSVNNCDINNNYAFYSGAAVCITGGTVYFNSVKISENKTIKGGGVYLGSGSSLTVSRGSFTHNSANQGNSVFIEKGALLNNENIFTDEDIFKEE